MSSARDGGDVAIRDVAAPRPAGTKTRRDIDRRVRHALLGGALLAFLAAMPVTEAADHAAGWWTTLNLSAPVHREWTAGLIVQSRLADGVETLDRVVLRPMLTRRLDNGFALTAGYDAHLLDAPVTGTEHRAWQQIARGGQLGGTQVFGHFRLEERFADGVRGTALRGRWLLGARHPTGWAAAPWAVVRNEAFVNLNSPEGGPQSGFDQNRAFAGFARPLGHGAEVEVGYQMQVVERAARRDLVLHQAFLTLSFKFD